MMREYKEKLRELADEHRNKVRDRLGVYNALGLSRDQFEEYYSCKSGVSKFDLDEDGNYTNFSRQAAWELWQASREAICVELPQQHHYLHLPSGSVLVSAGPEIIFKECKWAIERLGIKTK